MCIAIKMIHKITSLRLEFEAPKVRVKYNILKYLNRKYSTRLKFKIQ